MSNQNVIITNATITAFVDGELDDEQMKLVENLILNNPDAHDKYILMRDITLLVKEAFRDVEKD